MGSETIAVLGPGLIGGSIAMALRRRAPETRVHLWARREAALDELRSRGIGDLVSGDLGRVCGDAGLVVLATPIGAMPDLAKRILSEGCRPGAVFTDVGSVKERVVEAMAPVFEGSGAHFVGSHPMAGSEKVGLEFAREDLFENSVCILTPTAGANPVAVTGVDTFWQELGSRTFRVSPREHDAQVARISHLPHIVASALVLAAIGDDPSALRFKGGGWRDTTRVASGPEAMWSEILLQNRDALRPCLESMSGKLREVLALLDNLDDEKLIRFLRTARELRETPDPAP